MDVDVIDSYLTVGCDYVDADEAAVVICVGIVMIGLNDDGVIGFSEVTGRRIVALRYFRIGLVYRLLEFEFR